MISICNKHDNFRYDLINEQGSSINTCSSRSFRKKISRSLLPLTLFLLFHSSFVIGSELERKTNQSFYSLVASIQTSSIDQKITELKHFISQNPQYINAYLTLLEWYIYHNRINQSESYFQILSQESVHAKNAFWMLAKIYNIQEMPEKAFKSFLAALRISEPTTELLYEFIEFDHRQSKRFNGSSIIEGLELGNDLSILARAIYDYFQLKDQLVVDALSQLPSKLTNKAIVLDMWGTNYLYLSQIPDAVAKWQLGYKLAHSQNNLRMKSRFLTNLGFLAQLVDKDYELALSRYDSAYAIAEESSDYHRIQMLFGSRGYIYREMGLFEESEKNFREAIRICTNLLKPRFLADWHKGYGLTLYYLARYREAFNELHKGQQIAIKSNNEYYIVQTLFDRAELYTELKQYVLAEKDLKSAFELSNEKGMVYERETALAMIGRIKLEQGEYTEARKFFLKYIGYLQNKSVFDKETYLWTGKVAATYYREGNMDKAGDFYLNAFNEATSVKARNYQGWYQLGLGDIAVKKGNLEIAGTYYDSTLKIASAENVTEMLWKTYMGYGQIKRLSGKLSEAIESYKQAAEIIEKTRNDLDVDRLRIGYFVEGQTVYKTLMDCYLERYRLHNDAADLDSIFHYLSMGRSRGLIDIQLQSQKTAYNDEYIKSVQKLQKLQRLLRFNQHWPESEKTKLHEQITNLRLTLLAQKLRSSNLEDKDNPDQNLSFPSLTDIKRHLKEANHGLLVYNLAENNSFVLVIADKQSEIVILDSVDSDIIIHVDSLISPFHQIIHPDSIQRQLFHADLAYKLYQLLVKPIEKQIVLPENLLIVPDIALMNLPFEMLLSTKPDQSVYSPMDFPEYASQFLVQRYSVTYIPSLFHVLKVSKNSTADPKMAVFANPLFLNDNSNTNLSRFSTRHSEWKFVSLPFTSIEASQLQKIHKNTKIFIGNNAEKSTLKTELARNDIIHIATHGFVDSTFDAFSGLALAMNNDSTDDGLFMGYEIQDLELQCELVTLSACETGCGRVIAGEGVLGLPRLFLGAGANSVLMTLWQIEDKFTSEFMKLFYDKYLNENFTKSEALSEAKRIIIGHSISKSQAGVHYQHPFYWAAFTLYGNPGNRSQKSIKVWIWFFLIGIVLTFIIVFFRKGKLKINKSFKIEGGRL